MISEETAAQLAEMMTSVVDEGTAAALAGDLGGTTFAGKTGTAEIDIEAGHQPALVHRLRAGRGSADRRRGDGRALHRLLRRRHRRADRHRRDERPPERRLRGARMRLLPDQVVDGRYRLIERIGSGGMADVWRAHDTELGRDVAIKVLHENFARDKRVRRALPPRGVVGGGPPAPERGQRLRPRRVGGHLLHRDGADRGLLAARPDQPRARASARRSRSRGRCSPRRASPTRAGSSTAT